MTDRHNQVSIKQRIPLDILCLSLQEYLTEGKVNEPLLIANLQSAFAGPSGVNRARIEIKAVIANPAVADFLSTRKVEILDALKRSTDAKAIAFSLINSHFLFCYHVASLLAKHFRLETELSKDAIMKLISKKFQMNVTGEKALKIALQHMLDTCIISRPRIGLYSFGTPLKVYHKVTTDLWKECYYINNPLISRTDTESLLFDPYFNFIES